VEASGKIGAMTTRRGQRRRNDPSAGGKRSAMPVEATAVPAETVACDLTDESASDQEPQHNEDSHRQPQPLAAGRDVIAQAVKTLPAGPGVYRMINRRGEALYVGKARSLRKRVASYAQLGKLPHRLLRMVAETAKLEVIATHTEAEALLLESNLIKRHMPRYNVLLRDDKSFPYILITGDHAFPQVTKHRGAHERDGDYFGPFASAGAVNRTITALEKAFLLRSCSDAVFAARTRPCLMHQIKRCAAPCVDLISREDYQDLVDQTRAFLTGRSHDIQHVLSEEMRHASERLDFEAAAVYRDRLRALAHIQSHQDVNVEGLDDADVIAAYQDAGHTCVQVFFFRAGRNYGNRAHFPSHDRQLDVAQVLAAFTAQFYDNKPAPRLILLSHRLSEQDLIAEALSQREGRKVALLSPQRGGKRKLVESALMNAREALARRLAESGNQRRLLEQLAEVLRLEAPPERIEVYDNSHIQGADAYGAMIVAGPEGFIKAAYRKFRIKGAQAREAGDKGSAGEGSAPEGPDPKGPNQNGYTAGDDYAMMREVLTRRFTRIVKEDPERESGEWPELILIDGGGGQLKVAQEVLADLGLEDLAVAAIAKGPDRNAGRERIYLPGQASKMLGAREPCLYFLQRLRDEAHRFAIGTHRSGRTKSRLRSSLDEISGIGAKRKRALLHHFGSAKAVARAGLADLEAVTGISRVVARRIYDHFHGTP
jgi:excinuclease ABC subunit C